MIRTFLVEVSLTLAVLLFLPWLVLWSLLTEKPDLMYGMAMHLIRLETRFLKIRVRVEGLEHIPPRACVFVANHVSNLDPLVMIPTIPRRVGILAKRELFQIPIFSTAMRLAQFVPVDRGDRKSTGATVSTVVENLQKGLSYVVFSEGTRSPDGRMRPFKPGALTMAIEAGVAIVPVAVGGTHRLLGKGRSIVRPGEATVRFAPAIDASAYTMEQRGQLLNRVEAVVAAGLPSDQQPL
ncbi:MAG TPA: lysophospholipid acyltransferase family protein [Candidatus Acidoferrum sp.]|nr:lysophospholipid acyltransferase family protein [Candidatus Acidoferrum sp.]